MTPDVIAKGERVILIRPNHSNHLYIEGIERVPFGAYRQTLKQFFGVNPQWIKDVCYVSQGQKNIAQLAVFEEKAGEIGRLLKSPKDGSKSTVKLVDYNPLSAASLPAKEAYTLLANTVKRVNSSKIGKCRAQERRLV